jgi:signal transduction histidine kinase
MNQHAEPETHRWGFALPEDEASRDRLAELGQLAGGLVHELKNPLGAIDLNVAMLLEQCRQEPFDVAKAQKRLARIQASSQHLQDIVTSFLGFARPGRPDRDRVDVNELLRNLLDEQSEVLRVAKIQVSFKPDPDIAAVPADRGQLHSVFLNIVLNARDALLGRCDERKLLVATRARRGRVLVVIANNGPPLTQNAASHLFEPFFSDKENGTGLGLAVVRRLVELHHGTVRVNSDPAQGVSFTIQLPTNLGPAHPRTQLPMPEVEAVVRDEHDDGSP